MEAVGNTKTAVCGSTDNNPDNKPDNKVHDSNVASHVANTSTSWTLLSEFYRQQGSVSISEKTSNYKFSQSLEAARFVFRIVWLLRALLPTCLSNLKAIQQLKRSISRLRHFARSQDNTSYGILKQTPDNPFAPWASCLIRKIAGCACAGNAGKIFPDTAC